MEKPKRVAIYVRVSKHDQTTENQLPELQEFCASRGWQIVATFDDSGISGAKKSRPELDECMAFVRARRCDCLLVWRFDRFARSLPHLVNTLEELRELHIDFASVRNGTDTTTPQGKLLFGINALFAEYERDVMRERIGAGVSRVRSCKNCTHIRHAGSDCPCGCSSYVPHKLVGRPGVSQSKISEIIELRGKASIRQIAARLGVGRSVVHKVLSVKHGQNVASVIDETPVAF